MDKSALEGVRENGAIGAVDRIAINGREHSEKSAEKKGGLYDGIGILYKNLRSEETNGGDRFSNAPGEVNGWASPLKVEQMRRSTTVRWEGPDPMVEVDPTVGLWYNR